MFQPSRFALPAAALALLIAAAPLQAPLQAQTPVTTAPAGTYALDVTHSSVTFQVSHLGLSAYVANFGKLSGELSFDPANPSAMRVTAGIDPTSMLLPAPPAGFLQKLLGKDWLDAAAHPMITFRSTGVTLTGPRTADVAGDLTIKGVTKPVVLKATFNGGWAASAMGGPKVGFSAVTTFKRSDFGVTASLPPRGTSFGVGDEVKVQIETEWSAATPKG